MVSWSFRIDLSSGENIVSLKEAAALAINYLTILNIRHRGGIRFEVNIPNDLNGCRVPKLFLQPLVENAIAHGIERKKEAGMVRICATPRNHTSYIHVSDDGAGIPEERLNHLQPTFPISQHRRRHPALPYAA